MTADVELPPLPRWTQYNAHLKIRANSLQRRVQDYARTCVAHATAAKDAEIEALRAEVVHLTRTMGATTHLLESAAAEMDRREARAERLAEALRGLKDLMLEQVKWEPCDCGCPQQRTPDGPHSVTWLRAAQQVEIAINKAQERDKP